MEKTAKNCKKSYVSDKENGTNHSITVENVRQINLFLQNKANDKIGKMNLSLIIKDYVNLWLSKSQKQTQNKPNLPPIVPRPSSIFHRLRRTGRNWKSLGKLGSLESEFAPCRQLP